MKHEACELYIKVEFVRGNIAEYRIKMPEGKWDAFDSNRLLDINTVEELLQVFRAECFVKEDELIAWEIFRGELELYSIYSGIRSITVSWQKEMPGT